MAVSARALHGVCKVSVCVVFTALLIEREHEQKKAGEIQGCLWEQYISNGPCLSIKTAVQGEMGSTTWWSSLT